MDLTEFYKSLEILHAFGVTVLADVTFSEMWTAQRSKIQLQNLPSAHAAAIHNPLSPDDFAIRQDNPSFWINRLTDNAFMIAFRHTQLPLSCGSARTELKM